MLFAVIRRSPRRQSRFWIWGITVAVARFWLLVNGVPGLLLQLARMATPHGVSRLLMLLLPLLLLVVLVLAADTVGKFWGRYRRVENKVRTVYPRLATVSVFLCLR